MYQKAKEFADKYIRPHNQEIDRTGDFPTDIMDQIGQAGYFDLVIPEKYGGKGFGLKETIETIYAFSEASPTVGLIYTMHPAAVVAMYENDNEALAEEVSRDIVENKRFMTGAHSEFETGCHCISVMDVEDQVVAKRFTGRKSMITAGGYAYYYLTTTPPSVEEAQDYWMFTKDMDGISFDEDEWEGLGMRANMAVPMNFDQVEASNFYRVGCQAFNSTVYFNLGLAAVYAAISKRTYDDSLAHVKERKYDNDSSLIDFDNVKHHISQIYRMSISSKAMIDRVVDTFENNRSEAMKETLTARILASESSVQATTKAMRIGGGKAYNKHNIIESLHRDSLASQVMTPSLDVLEKYVADML